MRLHGRIRLCTFVLLTLVRGAAAGDDISLRDYCPPGFERTEQNRCLLRTLYQNYDSLHSAGVGGPKTGLPAARDGFSPQQIDLGRYLFFDPMLSSDNSISCASCHHPDLGFSDGRVRSVGLGGMETRRAAPSLWNVAFLKSFFWDARAASLEQQLLGPLYDEKEMGNNPARLLASIQGDHNYRRLFRDAYPGREGAATLDQIYVALAAFQSSLISLNSRYDQYAHGYHAALNENEKAGMNVFRSFVARCAECHTPPLFTNQQIAVIGARDPEGVEFDSGAEDTTGNPGLRGGFKVPSLRNIEQTAPYMHSGAFENLRDAAEFYTLGRGHALPESETDRVTVHWHIWEPELTDNELDRLVDFLRTLSDESFKPHVPDTVPSGLRPIGVQPDALATHVSSSKQPKRK